MIVIALLWIIFSPFIPMIYLFTRYYAAGANRLVIGLVMFAVCALICFSRKSLRESCAWL
ncbi:MAG: hypothetical protein K6D92_02800 [Erysipelotrichaceae bacterium]|nr:hypothetical protein [Erysipelotrichaceae bacterium]